MPVVLEHQYRTTPVVEEKEGSGWYHGFCNNNNNVGSTHALPCESVPDDASSVTQRHPAQCSHRVSGDGTAGEGPGVEMRPIVYSIMAIGVTGGMCPLRLKNNNIFGR